MIVRYINVHLIIINNNRKKLCTKSQELTAVKYKGFTVVDSYMCHAQFE